MFHPFVGQPVEPLPVAILGIWKRADVIIHIMNAAGDRNNHPFHQKDSKVAEWMQDMYRHLYIYIICVCVRPWTPKMFVIAKMILLGRG